MSMSSHHREELERRHDRYGLRVAAALEQGAQSLPADISERLRVARLQALQRRKKEATAVAHVVLPSGGVAILGRHRFGPGWWPTLGAAIPALALVLGLIGIHVIQNDQAAEETAEIDAALLLDELPPEAYTDAGFAQFLKTRIGPSQ